MDSTVAKDKDKHYLFLKTHIYLKHKPVNHLRFAFEPSASVNAGQKSCLKRSVKGVVSRESETGNGSKE